MTFTLTTEQEIIDKCGVDADTDLTGSSALLLRYCTQAEGKVCGISRYDWINNTPTASWAIALLSDTVSDFAAIKIIKDSMVSYWSRAVAQTMLDVLIDNANSNMAMLKDSTVKTAMGGA